MIGDLLAATASLVDISSVSRDERAIADFVEDEARRYPFLEVVRIDDNVVARTTYGRESRMILGGHLDTVPPAGNDRARIDGERLYGCGSADMKGGIAVLLSLLGQSSHAQCDVTTVFYSCEEIARRHSGLLAIEREARELLEGDVAVLLEPTAGRVECGCQGVLRAEITMVGERAHSARPWTGVNAIHRLGEVIERLSAYEPRLPVIDGCEFRESVQAVQIDGGVAGNVVPDAARLVVSHRFAPDRTADEAFAGLEELLSTVIDRYRGDRIDLLESAPAAHPHLEHPMLRALVDRSGSGPSAKLAWTDVAFFAERAIPAANFGPGDPLVAHTADEFVDRQSLDRVKEVLGRLLVSAP